MKKCTGCGKEKPETLEFFSFYKRGRNGFNSKCKICAIQCKKLFYQKYREKNLAYSKEYVRQGISKEWKRQHRIKMSQLRPLYKHAVNMHEGMARRSNKKGLDFDKELFSINYIENWLKDNPKCECCGKEFRINSKKIDNLSPSLDRICLSKGYVFGNVALICWRCNNLKRDAIWEELQMIVNWIKSKQIN